MVGSGGVGTIGQTSSLDKKGGGGQWRKGSNCRGELFVKGKKTIILYPNINTVLFSSIPNIIKIKRQFKTGYAGRGSGGGGGLLFFSLFSFPPRSPVVFFVLFEGEGEGGKTSFNQVGGGGGNCRLRNSLFLLF